MPLDDPAHTALLLMDYQAGIADRFVASGEVGRAAALAAAARAAGVRVLYCKVGFAPGYPEIGDRNKFFAPVRGTGRFEGEASRLLPEVGATPGDTVIDKKRYGAFAGSALELILRAHDVRALVLAGIKTSGVVLSTVRLAADLDYTLTVVADACNDPEPDVHTFLVGRVLPAQAEIVTADAWIGRAGGGRAG